MTLKIISTRLNTCWTRNLHDVSLTSGELVVNSILQVDNVEASVVALTVSDDTNTTHVATTGDHDDHASVELDEVGDLACGEVDLDGVVDLNGRVGVADSTHILSINHRHRQTLVGCLVQKVSLLHLAQTVVNG
jgi:hypothetical protein